MITSTDIKTTVPEEMAGERLDVALAQLYPDYSRNRIKQWILDGQILVDGVRVKPREKLLGNEELQIRIEAEAHDTTCRAEPIDLDIIYEDEALIVINKPAGLVVHPAAGHLSGTLQNALLHHDPALEVLPRSGIVHRIDKDTTGLLVVARNLKSHTYLIDQMQKREIHREYQAVVHGVLTGGGTIDQPIGRHPKDRKRMSVRDGGKPSVTHYRVIKRYRAHTHIAVTLESGRTHQIRVHMQYIKHPIVGDPVYSGRQRLPAKATAEFIDTLKTFDRQALHAFRLTLNHPETEQEMTWQAPLPDDFEQLLAAMAEDLVEPDDG